MASILEQWLEKSRYDLETASAMQASGRYFYVLFCCQQAVEKMLKAHIVKQTGEMPPRIHDLARLTEVAGITASEKDRALMRNLSRFYMKSRYPDDREEESSRTGDDHALSVLTQTRELIQWLNSML